MLLMCARYERALMTQEIVRSKDAQCNTEESPFKIKVSLKSCFHRVLYFPFFFSEVLFKEEVKQNKESV